MKEKLFVLYPLFIMIYHIEQVWKLLSVNVGDNVKLSCAQSSGSWTISWYQQKAGGGPSYLLATGTSSGSRANGLPSRFTYSGSAGNTQYLHINGVCVYYYKPMLHHDFQPQHTSLFSLSKPSLVLMAPAQAPLSRDNTTLLCLAQGFHPDGASLSWSADSGSLTSAEIQKDESQRQPDGTSVPSTHWSSGQTFTCRLSQHFMI
uniref:Ig-like domain-containing protein n=1 Tax=Oncorhynchus kisutch TaxID=8019 RepID=A0A8C7FFF5_ONCKI